jgi:protein-S-isoprenylcysteine O-methyltransferase Ste14
VSLRETGSAASPQRNCLEKLRHVYIGMNLAPTPARRPQLMANSAELSANASPHPRPGWSQSPKLRHAASNLGLALLFFCVLVLAIRSSSFRAAEVRYSPADLIWIVGTVLMALLSLIRVPPTIAMVNLRAVMATTGMMVAPAAMRHVAQSAGLVAQLAVAVEFMGMATSQVSRLYLGRRFGLLPANRGIVKSGPFRFVRHPIYAGWLMLAAGFVMAYPSWLNLAMLLITMPFMVWRIALEEELLRADPAYRAYCETTRYRLIPGII